MIFIDKLREREKILNPEFDRLIELAWHNQSHKGDLLLLHINGFYEESINKNNAFSDKKYNPHVIGPGREGHSELTHYSFIDKYRKANISKLNFSEYLKLHDYTSERSQEIDELVDLEETGIQLEMLVYLKFWEADMIIKKLYQFVRILYGEPYDWYFKVQESSRAKNSSGSRHDIIRLKIRDRLQKHSQIVYDLITNTYKTQIRNSIAHSNYSFQGRIIHPNNFIEGDPSAQLQYITFDEWIDIFHNTLVLHNQYIRMNNEIKYFYAGIAKKNGNEMEIRVTEKNGEQYPIILEYRPEWEEWTPKI
jgi:hypothetical protein